MMDTRRKLVELLINTIGLTPTDAEIYANDFIAHGITAQRCGHWVSLTDCANAGVYCSVCHKKVYKEDYAYCSRKNKLRSNYCPHCGAKMDGCDGNSAICSKTT